MKIYHHPFSQNCRKVLATAKQLGLDYEEQIVALDKGEQQSAEFLQKNPAGAVPVLEHDGQFLRESSAIQIFMNDQKGGQLYPEGQNRHDANQWLFWESCHFSPACNKHTFERLLKPMLGMGEADEAAVEAVQPNFHRHAKLLDEHLAQNKYMMGDEISIVDYAVASPLTYAEVARMPVDQYQNIKQWMARMDENPAWKESAPDLSAFQK